MELFSPICCIVGHVDVGKTKLLDYLRKSNTREASGITQQIGATYYNTETITSIMGEMNSKISVPGIIIIDTPGHECFTMMRRVGVKVSHIVILMIDLIKGVEKETIESLKLLTQNNAEFIIALNKLDRVYGWKPQQGCGLKKTYSKQSKDILIRMNDYVRKIICQLAENEINACLYYENKDPKSFVSMVPISASSGEGVPDLLLLISKLIEKRKREVIKTPLYNYTHGYIIDYREDPKFGDYHMAINGIGKLSTGDELFVNDVKSKVKNILVMNDNVEMKDKSGFKRVDSIEGTHGIGLIFEDRSIKYEPGSKYIVTDNIDLIKNMLLSNDAENETSIDIIQSKLRNVGITIVAPSVNIIDGMLKSFNDANIHVADYIVGTLDKIGIIKANKSIERYESLKDYYMRYNVILLFDPVIIHKTGDELIEELDPVVLKLANEAKIKIMASNTIYKLKEQYLKYIEELDVQLREKYTKLVPYKAGILPKYIFLKCSPLLFGIRIIDGKISVNSKVKATNGEKTLILGKVIGIQKNKKDVQFAVKNDEVCIKIDNENKYEYGTDFNDSYVLMNDVTLNEQQIYKTISHILLH